MASITAKEATMTDFTITEDFPNSEIEFDQRFNSIDACYGYLARTKRPDGSICEKCGCTDFWRSCQNIYICQRCEHQVSLTAGTIMHGTKKPITYWFKAMWWFTGHPGGRPCPAQSAEPSRQGCKNQSAGLAGGLCLFQARRKGKGAGICQNLHKFLPE